MSSSSATRAWRAGLLGACLVASGVLSAQVKGEGEAAAPPPRDPFSRVPSAPVSSPATASRPSPTRLSDVLLADVVVVGTLVTATQQIALITGGDPRTWLVRRNDTLGDATVVGVALDGVTFRARSSGDARAALDLHLPVSRGEPRR